MISMYLQPRRAGQPLHKRGRVWCHAYTRVVPVLVQHLRLRAVRKTALVKIWQLVGQNVCWGQPQQIIEQEDLAPG